MPRTLYELLGVPSTATRAEIDAGLTRRETQYRDLVRAGKHPDQQIIERIRKAHQTLINPDKRAAYDRALARAASSVASAPSSGGASLPRAGPATRTENGGNFLARAWRGEVRARRIFGFFVLPAFLVLVGAGSTLGQLLFVFAAVLAPWLTLVLLTALLLIYLAGAVLLWRCAFNVDHRIMGYAGRVAAVLVVAQVGLVLYMAATKLNASPRWAARPPASKPAQAQSLEARWFAAARAGDASAIRKLLGEGIAVDTREKGPHNKGRTALHYAAGEGRLEAAKLLVEAGADVNAAADTGYVPLHVAAGRNQPELVRFLLAQRAHVEALDVLGTPLHAAVLQGHEQIVEILLAHRADPNAQAPRSADRPLHVFAMIGTYYPSHTPIIRKLLDAGADPNVQNAGGATPLSAITRRSEDAVLLLLQRGAKAEAMSRDGVPAAHSIAGQGYARAVDQVLANGLPLDIRTAQGETLLHWAAGSTNTGLVERLVAKGLDPNVTDDSGRTPLFRAVRAARTATVDSLLRLGADVNARDKQGRTPIHLALETNHKPPFELAARLAAAGARLDIRDLEGLSLLDISVGPGRGHNTDAALWLLDKGLPAGAPGPSGRTPLHCASAAAAVELLVSRGAKVDVPDRDRRTPLHAAAAGGHEDVLKALIDSGASTKARTSSGSTVLHELAGSRAYTDESIPLLVKSGNDPNARDNGGRTPLHRAAAAGRGGSVDLLIKLGAEVDATDTEGNTPLHEAARAGTTHVARRLIEAGAKTNARNQKGQTPADLASARSEGELSKVFSAAPAQKR